MSTLAPVHSSLLKNGGMRIARGMSRVTVSQDVREGMERIALDIFADMSNAGFGFAAALAAIYVSGLQHAIEAKKERA